MALTTFSIRMDENLKRQFDALCDDFGMNMTTAFTIFAKTVVRERQIPFKISSGGPFCNGAAANVPQKPAGLEELSKEELEAKLQRGLADTKAGRYYPAEEVFAELEQKHLRRYGI